MQRYQGREGLARFSDAVAGSLVDQAVEPRAPDSFTATLAQAAVGDAHLVHASVGPLRSRRRAGVDAASGSVFLLLARRGRGRISHRGGDEAIEPGRLVVVPGEEAFDVEYREPASLLFVVLPPPVVLRRWPGLDGPVRSVPMGPVARPLAGQLPQVLCAALAADDADRSDLAALLDANLHLVLRGSTRTAGWPLLSLRVAAERIAERHLDDPDLSVGWLARRLSVSVRQLHRAFATGHVPPAEHLRQRRLGACARALADSPSARVTDVASRYGFASASHLSAAFRRSYGETPAAWQARHASARNLSEIV